MKTQIIQKLTSRKFWVAVASIVSGMVVLFGYAETTAETVVGGVLLFGGAMGFMLTEGAVDVMRFVQALKGVGIIFDALKDGPGQDEDDAPDNENDVANTENDTEKTEGGADNGDTQTEQNL